MEGGRVVVGVSQEEQDGPRPRPRRDTCGGEIPGGLLIKEAAPCTQTPGKLAFSAPGKRTTPRKH